MNLYLCYSEQLINFLSHFSLDPPEPYAIYEIVAAESRSQARYLAWKSDRRSFEEDDITSCPKFSIKLLKKNVNEDKGIVPFTKYEYLIPYATI